MGGSETPFRTRAWCLRTAFGTLAASMERHCLRLSRLLPITALTLLAACGGSGAARSPEESAATHARLLAPFQLPRQAVCDELEIDLSAGFFGELTRPAQIERRAGSADLTTPDVYTATTENGLAQPIEMAVAGLKFAVLRKAIVRVHAAAPARLDLSARGNVDLVSEAGTRMSLGELAISQGLERRLPR